MLLILVIIFGALALASGLVGLVGFFAVVGIVAIVSRLARIAFPILALGFVAILLLMVF